MFDYDGTRDEALHKEAMRLKMAMQDGTRSDSANLCTKCSYSLIFRGSADSQQQMFCNVNTLESIRLPYRIAECNRFTDRTAPSIHDMEQIAWVLVTKSAGRQVGFVSAKEFSKRNSE